MNQLYLYGNISTNTQVGIDALANLTTGEDNTAFGTNALQFLTTGDGNAGFGIDVAANASGNPSFSSGFGTDAIMNINATTGISAFGYQSLMNLTTGTNNSAFGFAVAQTLTTGTEDTLFGANANVSFSGTVDSVAVGSGDIGVGTQTITSSWSTIIGHGCRDAGGGETVKIGSEILSDESSSNMVVMGRNAGGDETLSHFGEVLLGRDVLSTPTAAFFPSVSESVAIGVRCGLNTTESSSDTIVGHEAYQGSHFGQLNAILGARANRLAGDATNTASQDCVILGYEAGVQNFRDKALPAVPEPSDTIVGAFAGNGITEETFVTCAGYQAMETAKGSSNTAAGYRALRGPTSYNTTDISAGTSVGVGKLTNVTKVRDGDNAVGEVSDLDFTGSTPAGLDGSYFLLSSISNDYYVWWNLDDGTTDPGPPGLNLPALVGKTGIDVDIATGDTPGIMAGKTRTRFDTVNDFTGVVTTFASVIEVTNIVNGNVTDIAPGVAVGKFKLNTVTKIADGTVGTPEVNWIDSVGAQGEVLAEQYFLISSTTVDYYVWFRWSFVGTDPGPGGQNLPALVGKTGIQVTLATGDTDDEIAGKIITALNGSGAFTAAYRSSEYLRLITANSGDNNVAVGNNAFAAMSTGSDNVVMGSDAAPLLTDGSNNVLLGRSVGVASGTNNATIAGGGASATSSDSTVLGAGASSTASGGIAVGSGATVSTADSCQLAPAAVSGAGILRYRSQIVSDESWIGGGTTTMMIDNSGNICRATPVANTGSTIDATPLNLVTWAIANDTVRRIEAMVTGRRTGGGAGSVNDTASYYINVAAKNDGGVLTVHLVSKVILEDQPAWDATFIAVGTDAHLQVTGAAMNNINWNAQIRTYTV